MNIKTPFFSGIAGSGMSALAQYLAMQGSIVKGSDRSLDQGKNQTTLMHFKDLNIQTCPQDGSGLTPDITCLITSTAIEGDNAELLRAKTLNIPVYHRSDLLAFLSAPKTSIAVAGTSGKSTVTAMVYEIFKADGKSPSLITGAPLLSLKRDNLLGNALGTASPWLIFEADESDGSLIKYHTDYGILLNVDKDHKEMTELEHIFQTFYNNVKKSVLFNRGDKRCLKIAQANPDKGFYFSSEGIEYGDKLLKVTNITSDKCQISFKLENDCFQLNTFGHHNLLNALAAIGMCLRCGIPVSSCVKGIHNYQGIDRRMQILGNTGNVMVIDDFAHNGAKIEACLKAVKGVAGTGRIIAIFHPHGFGPMKLLRKEITGAFINTLSPQDIILFPEIYYAGGTADKSISSQDLIKDIKVTHPNARFLPDKAAVLEVIKTSAVEGDTIINMGARDPGLAAFAKSILQVVSKL